MSEIISFANLQKTKDGSDTIFHPGMNQHYHSIHGAIQESVHVFINSGLKAVASKEISILEIGFGTALNGFLTLLEAYENELSVHYTAIEPYPVQLSLAAELNYAEKLNALAYKNEFIQMHVSKEGEWISISENFQLKKIPQKIQEADLDDKFDLVYFDAFGPGAQQEMWLPEVFIKIYKAMKPGGILTTYCAKGEVKRRLKQINFEIESLPGPPGKREMIRALKVGN